MAEDTLSIPTARREPRDIPGLFIPLAFLLGISGLAVVGLVCWWIFPRAPRHELVPYPVPSYPPPQLQADPHEDMVRFYRQELDQLNSIGWVDRARGLVHVPIDQAMRMVAKEGIKDWPAPAQAERRK